MGQWEAATSQIVLKSEMRNLLVGLYAANLQPGQAEEYRAGFTQAIIAVGLALGIQPDALGVRVEPQNKQLERGTR